MSMKVLALCGSLRSNSLCAGLLRATRSLAPVDMDFRIHDGLGRLPLFNPELEPEAPACVHALWGAVAWSDAIVIASPEYAHGVTGTIKNALDWLVGHIPFAYKPVAVFNPAYESHHADAALKETLRTMSADLIADACLRIPVIGSGLAADDLGASRELCASMEAALRAIVLHVEQLRALPDCMLKTEVV